MGFRTPLDSRELSDYQWMLLSDLVYKGKSDIIVVPKGFITDFASVPRFLWSIIPPYGKYTKAAVVHDFLYKHRPLVLAMDGGQEPISRKDSDGIFSRIMKELGTSTWRRWSMYKCVSKWGYKAWNEHRENEQQRSTD